MLVSSQARQAVCARHTARGEQQGHRAPLRVAPQGVQVFQQLAGGGLQARVAALGQGPDALQGQRAPQLGGRRGHDFRLQHHRLDEAQHGKALTKKHCDNIKLLDSALSDSLEKSTIVFFPGLD